MAYFATEYTIHFDDTMAYGSHHFLTAFKFQCASRESFLFGERIFDLPGVKDALDSVHLLTVDAYARNLSPARLGDRLAILLSLEEWGQASARFCYRVLGQQGQAVCAGYQTLVCAGANSQAPIPLPLPLQQAMHAMREIEEPHGPESFRDRILAGGSKLDTLFGEVERESCRLFLSQRYPSPQVVAVAAPPTRQSSSSIIEPDAREPADKPECEAWVFGGQATFDAQLFGDRIKAYAASDASAREELDECREITGMLLGGDVRGLFSDSIEQCKAAVKATPAFSQIAIHLQNVLGAKQWRALGHVPKILLGHSFGELAAFGVGGCYDLPTGVRAVCTRMRAIADYAPIDGGLLVVSTDQRTVETEASLLSLDQVVVAGRNHQSQTVMSGPQDQLQRLKLHLQSIQIAATSIDSPTSFHHPRLRAAASSWLKELRALQMQTPSLAVYSPISRRLITSADDICAVLASHLTRPFDFQGAVAELLEAGVNRFVDCGSSGLLARLISKAGAQDLDVCCVRTEQLASLPQPTTKAPESPQIAQPANAPAVASSSGSHADPQFSEALPNDSCVPRVAIVGQGCILPGGVSSPAELFTAITEQRVGIVDQQFFDPHWSADFYSAELKPDRSNSHLFGRVRDEDISAPGGVAAHIFDGFTRTQKLLCVALAPCLASLKGAERIMCLLGSTADGFEDQDDVASLRLAGIDPCQPEVDQKMHTARSASHDPHSAVQEVLDRIVGPGLKVTLVDAACASSLYSLALGMQALETNKADAVIAGGFFCPGPGNSCLFSQFRGTTSTGCRPFDAHADGVVFSEGAALVTLRRVADAERLGLNIDAIVAGAGLSSDGRSPSANVPQSRGQLLSLERCYANYGIDPASIIAIEGHGTSTPVGDGTELETLRRFFAGRTSSPIPVHSLKGLLGHAGWAAGTASVIAVCQYMRHAVFPSQAMFRQPSTAVLDSAGTLMVSSSCIALPPLEGRIAVDGFGFGGANAHVVLENYGAHQSKRQAAQVSRPSLTHNEEELVVVAQHWQRPSGSARFDREQVKVPKKFIILPQLADDMDISQALAIIVTEKVLGQLPQFDDVLRRETSLVLAMSGKTERGVEATLRIMTPRIRRVLQGNERLLQRLDAAYFSARPSGAYTLQCMMPNVASGRAALLLNLNGPNFVVDAGADSLEAAFTSAALLLRSGDLGGTKLVVVAAIAASGGCSTDPDVDGGVDNLVDSIGENADLGHSEFAVAYAVTTRRTAAARGLSVMASLNSVFRPAEVASNTARVESRPYRQVQALQTALENAAASAASTSELAEGAAALVPPPAPCAAAPSAAEDAPANCSPALASRAPQGSDCQIQVPVWVEKTLAQALSGTAEQRVKNMLVIVKAGFTRHRELCDALPQIAEQFVVAVVGDSAQRVVSTIGHPSLLAVDLTDAQTLPSELENICRHAVDVVAVVDEATSWDLSATLANAALDNNLCELLFLIGKREAARLKSGNLELWGVIVDAWNGQAHPCSGPIAGLLKSIQREFPAARSGTLCTQGLELPAALDCLLRERVQSDREQEVACGPEFRLVRRLRPAAMDRNASPQVELDEHSIVVAIGGAKGVTAVMLESLLSDFKCKVIAIGRSPLEAGPEGFDGAEVEQAYYTRFLREHPQRSAVEMRNSFAAARGRWEAHQTVQELAAQGGQVEYLVADATDAEQMAATVQDIVSRYGKIDLLLYGAGVQKSKRLEDRSLADFRDVFSAKVTGLHHLVRACYAQLGHVPSVHVLTSAYSVFGNDGQHDYGAANETLDRLCGLTQDAAERGWTSIAWLAWDGIGMTRGTEYRALAKKRRLSGVDPELGQRLFREVLAGYTRSAINVPMSEAEHVEYAVQTVPFSSAGTSGRVVEWDVQLSSIQCLPFHRVRNIPTLPGAWILDLLVGVGRKLAPHAAQGDHVVVHDMSFAKFVRIVNNHEPNVRVVAQQCDNGVAVWMIADVLHPSGVLLAKDRICASAHLVWGTGEELAPHSKLRSNSQLETRHVVRDPYCNQRKDVALSGLFDCLSDIELNDQGRTAKFMPSNCQGSADNIPSLLLDAAWRVGAMYTASRPNEVFVPVKIGRMTLPLETCCTSSSSSAWEIRSTAPRSEERDVRWGRTEVFDQAGRLKIIIEDALATPIV